MNNNSSLVSVIVPAYNAAAYLGETVASALGQTYRSIEVIVVDDGSTDRTADIAQAFVRKNPRVRYMRQENQGQSAARKNGLLQSKGEWVLFLDADNILLPHACETLMKHAESGCDVYYGDIRYFDAQAPERLFRFSLHYTPEVKLESLIEHNFINFLGTLIRREKVLDCFDERFRRADDHVIWLKLVLKNAAFCHVDAILGRLRFHSKNLSFEESYLLETAETNLVMFDWLEEEARKKYPDDRLRGILDRIETQRGLWRKKGYLGALIMRDREKATAWLLRLHTASRNRAMYHFLRAILFFTPLWLASPILRYVRRRLVMRKYTLVSGEN